VTKLFYFRARWYDPAVGKWLSKDPIGISGGLNQYVAFNNSPVNFVDPSGLIVQIHSRYVQGSGEIAAHTYVTVTDQSGTQNTYGSYNANGRNVAQVNNPADVGTAQTSTITVPPPSGMTQAQWDEAVNRAGWNRVITQDQRYKLLGGDGGNQSGNCHTTTKNIITDAGGAIPAGYDPPGRNPGLH
jgi:uncharacterized protein RhaS with RHS repeats